MKDVRRPAAPTLLAFGAAFAGLLGVVSAMTPEMADRIELVRGVLPPGVPNAARTVALAFALALVWLARGLARRKRRAWQLSVVLVLALGAAHLAKGLDFEEALVSFALLAALWRTRHSFDAPGDPSSIGPLVQALLAMAALTPLAVVRYYDGMGYSDRIEDALGLILLALGVRALYLWLRPIAGQAAQSVVQRGQAEKLVYEYGTDSLSFFSLRRDKSWFFSPSGRSFLAYGVVNGTALITGDPIGDPDERAALISEFRRVARAKAWRVAIAGASEELLPLYRELGFKTFYLGDEAIVRPDRFSLEGRPIRKVRQSVHRLAKAGYTVRVLPVGAADERLRAELQSVSCEWRGNWPERGFTMAMDALFAYPTTMIAVAEGPEGRVGGFIQLVPSPAGNGYSLASMRRRPSTPNGLMEFLIVETVAWAREREVEEISLNFSVFAEALRADRSAPLPLRVLRFFLIKLDRLFQLDRLYSFNRKFFPQWRRRYLCFERWSDAPVVGLAYLHAESLLTPPGPWAYSPDVDLAAR